MNTAEARELMARELDTLSDDQQQELEDAYSATGQDEFAIGRKIRWEHQEAIRRGWLLGPA